MLRTIWILSLLILSPLAEAAGPVPSAYDKSAFEAYVRYLLLWGPEVRVEIGDPKAALIAGLDEITVKGFFGQAAQRETFYVAKDGHRIIRGSLLDVTTDPFESVRSKLRADGEPSFGPKDAPVEIVIFSDFQCPFCKQEANVIRPTLANAYPTQVRVAFKDLPLAPIHPWATLAAISGRCVFRQNPALFWDYHDWIFAHQSEITPENLRARVVEAMQRKGLNQEELDSCIAARATEADINRSLNEAAELGVTGTPILFVNGRMMLGAAWPNLRAAIEAELNHQKKAKVAYSDGKSEHRPNMEGSTP